MKKFFIVLSALAALMLCVVPAQALVGSPDDVPGSNAVVPFICDRSLTSGLNTLIVFQDVKGGWATGGTKTTYAAVYHYTINTVRSVTVIDDSITGSPRAVVSTDAFTMLTGKAVGALEDLEVTINSKEYYAGYIYFYNRDAVDTATATDMNNAIGQFFFVNLAVGKAASANIPMKEYALEGVTTDGAAALQTGFDDWMVTRPGTTRALKTNEDANMERFSPNGLLNAIRLQAGETTGAAATTFYTFPRIYVADATAENWWLLWTSSNDVPTSTELHVDWYNTNETAQSSNIPMNNELMLIDSANYLPTGLWTAYPYSGYIDLNWTCNTGTLQNQEFLGWSYLQATGTANESWTVINPIARDVE